jgi:hypothetical protein
VSHEAAPHLLRRRGVGGLRARLLRPRVPRRRGPRTGARRGGHPSADAPSGRSAPIRSGHRDACSGSQEPPPDRSCVRVNGGRDVRGGAPARDRRGLVECTRLLLRRQNSWRSTQVQRRRLRGTRRRHARRCSAQPTGGRRRSAGRRHSSLGALRLAWLDPEWYVVETRLHCPFPSALMPEVSSFSTACTALSLRRRGSGGRRGSGRRDGHFIAARS